MVRDLIRVGLSSFGGGVADLKLGLRCGDLDLCVFPLCRRSKSRFLSASVGLDMDGLIKFVIVWLRGFHLD